MTDETVIVPDALVLLRGLLDVDPVDAQLAGTLVRRGAVSGERGVAIMLAALLVSRALRDGHSAITLPQLARQAGDLQSAAGHETLAALPLRDESWWRTQLGASPLVGDGTARTPLVLHGSLLQLHRYFAAEQRIGGAIMRLLREPVVDGVPGFSIITGGPGTGKTTRVARTLVAMVQQRPGVRVALAAPTGKAAARLTESIRLQVAAAGAALHADEAVLRALAGLEASTLHRLLRYSGDSDTFRRNAAEPLEHDLVIVDEASMVDVLMLDALLHALRPGARLMLVGDHHQLSSVEAGDVLGVLCRAAAEAGPGAPLHDAVTRLTTSWRFASQAGIGAMAMALLDGDGDAAVHATRDEAHDDLHLIEPTTARDALIAPVVPHLEHCLAATTVVEALDALEAFRLLAPERDGRLGVRALNVAVERWLARHGRPVTETWYHGRPVLVTANDYATRVFNGDIGVTWKEDGNVAVHFRGIDGVIRKVAPGRLPSVETAWAMTVHKSQGSEFDDVVVVLPQDESRVMSRELLYTAVTRARHRVTLLGTEVAVRAAAGQVVRRTSGLAAQLRG